MESGLDHNYNAILSTLTSAVKDSDKQTEARKHLRVERWLRVYIQWVEDFSGEELKFFSDIFSDNSCWNGTRLKNEIVGNRLIKEKNQNGKENPLDVAYRYYLACKYCLEDKIPGLFEQVFQRFKKSALREVRSDDELRKELLDHIKETNPIEAFWSSMINEQFEKLKEYEPVEGLQEAIKVNSRKNWGEGIEFFYNKLQSNPSIFNKGDLLINAALSATKGYKDADVMEFCLLNMTDKQKRELLSRDLKENTYHAVLSELIDGYCFDSFKNLFDFLKLNDLSFEQYGVILSSLSRRMLLNPDLAEQTREVIMYVWKHENFEEQRESVLKDYSFVIVVTNLIADLRRETIGDEKRKEEIQEILKCVEHTQVEELQSALVHRMSAIHGTGEEQFTNDQQLIEQLFSKLKDKELAIGAGEPADLPQSNLSLTTDALCNVKLSSHSK